MTLGYPIRRCFGSLRISARCFRQRIRIVEDLPLADRFEIVGCLLTWSDDSVSGDSPTDPEALEAGRPRLRENIPFAGHGNDPILRRTKINAQQIAVPEL